MQEEAGSGIDVVGDTFILGVASAISQMLLGSSPVIKGNMALYPLEILESSS